MRYKEGDIVWVEFENNSGEITYIGPAKITKAHLSGQKMFDYEIKTPVLRGGESINRLGSVDKSEIKYLIEGVG